MSGNNNLLSPKNIGKILLPKKIFSMQYRDNLKVVFERVKNDKIHYEIIFYIFISSLIVGLILFLFFFNDIYFLFESYLTSFVYQILILTAIFSVIELGSYWMLLMMFLMYFDSKLLKHEKEFEKDLPDFLDNLVSNLKGGYVLEKALVKSVREDQKALMSEVTLINEKVMAGTPVIDALYDLRQRFNSPIISRTFFLIVEGLKGGGNMTTPLERISNNLKKIYLLDDEVKSNVGGFTVIIKAIGTFLSPALFALAITLLVFIGDLLILLSEGEGQIVNVSELPDEFISYLVTFSYSMIILVSIFSNLIIAQLKGEPVYRALKSIPITIIISCTIYYFLSGMLIGYFSTII